MSPLPRPCLLLVAVLGLALPAAAQKPRFATVDVSKAFEAYSVTIAEKEKIRQARADLERDPRVEKIKLFKVELLDLRDKVRDTTLSEGQRQEHFRQFQLKNDDLRSLQRATAEHLDEQAAIIDAAMVKKTRELLGKVQAVVQEVAQKGEFDFVFETGGKTSSQIPTLLYIRAATDITDLVIAELNSGAAADKDIATTVDGPPVRP